MDVQRRKQNRLPEYDYSQNGAYFLTICTHKRKPFLSKISKEEEFPILTKEGQIVENVILSVPEKYPAIAIDRYILMPDHIHLLVRVEKGTGNPSPTVGKAVAWLKYNATKQINCVHGIIGQKRFQRSFYDHVIRSEEDYDSIWMYIDNNPLSWKIKHGVVAL